MANITRRIYKWNMPPKPSKGTKKEPWATVVQGFFEDASEYGLTPHEMTLFLVLALWTDKNGVRWNPKRERLCLLSGISTKTYGKAIQRLVDIGLIRRVKLGKNYGYEIYPKEPQNPKEVQWVELLGDVDEEMSESTHGSERNSPRRSTQRINPRGKTPSIRDTFVSNELDDDSQPAVDNLDGTTGVTFGHNEGPHAGGVETESVAAVAASPTRAQALAGDDDDSNLPAGSLPLAEGNALGPSVPSESEQGLVIDISAGYPEEFGDTFPDGWFEMTNEERMKFNIGYYDPSGSLDNSGLFRPSNRHLIQGRVAMQNPIIEAIGSYGPRAADMEILRVHEMLAMAYHYFNKYRQLCPVPKQPHEPRPHLVVKVTDFLSAMVQAQQIIASRHQIPYYPFNLTCQAFFEWIMDNKSHKSWTWNMLPMLVGDWMVHLQPSHT